MVVGQTGSREDVVQHVELDSSGQLVHAPTQDQLMEEDIVQGLVNMYSAVTQDAVQVNITAIYIIRVKCMSIGWYAQLV